MTEALGKYAPKYRIVAEELRKQIQQGQYEANQAFASETELVQRYQVSRTTARKALDVLVRDRVVLRQKGRGTFVTPHQGEVQVATLVFSYPGIYSIHHPFLGSLYHGFEEGVWEFAQNYGQRVSVQCVRQAKVGQGFRRATLLHTEDPIQARAVNPHFTQGLCLTPSVSDEEIAEIQRRGIPCVKVIGATEVPNVPVVCMERYVPQELALAHLKELGHHDIGLVRTEYVKHEDAVRVTAWCEQFGLNIGGRYDVVCTDYKRELAYEGVKELLKHSDRPTALCCDDDFLALGACDAARELGLSVPGDLSIVGAGNYMTDADLTSVSAPLVEMGRQAARVLIEQVHGCYDGTTKVVVSGQKLVVRGSTGPAPVQDNT